MASDAPEFGKVDSAPNPGPNGAGSASRQDGYSIRELARECGISERALRHYQNKGLLRARRVGRQRLFDDGARDRLILILQGKRLGFTLTEIRQMLGHKPRAGEDFPISRQKCVEQIGLLERQRREIDAAIAELRRIYTAMFALDEPISGGHLRVKTS